MSLERPLTARPSIEWGGREVALFVEIGVAGG